MFSITCKECGFSMDVTWKNVSDVVCQPSWSSKGNISEITKGWAKQFGQIVVYTVNDDEYICGMACKCGNEV